IESEAGAYLGDRRDRVILEGPDLLIDPNAFTVLALVFHELITNAAKYGALADSGRVDVAWRLDQAGDVRLTWIESGGPAVTAPTRRGFGSTLIERSIPFELGGTAAARYRVTGLEVEFSIPQRHVAGVLAPASAARDAKDERKAGKQILSGKRVL